MPRISGSYHGEGIQAVLLAFRILEHMAQHRGAVGVTELALGFATTKSRIHRHLQTLMEGGYVIQDEGSDRYRVSARLMAMGEAVSENFDLSVAARPVLNELRMALGHSVAVSVSEGEGVRIVAVLRGGSSAEIGVKPGSLLPFHSSAQGKLALAFGDREIHERLLARGLTASTPKTIVDPNALATDLSAIKARGWATSADQTVLGLNALAAPIFSAVGQYAGAIAIVDSVQFISDQPQREQIDRVLAAAARVSETLGYRAAS
jgi:DNA-binding IclR family transcriptional regulator